MEHIDMQVQNENDTLSVLSEPDVARDPPVGALIYWMAGTASRLLERPAVRRSFKLLHASRLFRASREQINTILWHLTR